jgi:excinuclease ABC subunit A
MATKKTTGARDEKIIIKGARTHNLKNIDVEIPRGTMTAITGLSGSGKSSLAFDTIFAEGQRRYMQSLSTYARQFLERFQAPDVDRIENIPPTIALEQVNPVRNSRATVGTTTEMNDYLRLLFEKIGREHCPNCDIPVEARTSGEIIEDVRKIARKGAEVSMYAPLIRKAAVEKKSLIERVEKSGYEWLRINKQKVKINELANFPFEKETAYDVDLLMGTINDIKKTGSDPLCRRGD